MLWKTYPQFYINKQKVSTVTCLSHQEVQTGFYIFEAKDQTKNATLDMEGKIVIFPAAGLSHLVPMVELAKLILHRHPLRFSVTVLLPYGPFATPAASSYIHRLSQTNPSIAFHHFSHPSDDTSTIHRSREAALFQFLHISAAHVVDYLQQPTKATGICALIGQFFTTSLLEAARELGIPTYHFFTSGAAALAFFLHFPTIHDRTTESFKDLPTEVFGFPGLPPLKATHMPELVLDRDEAGYHGMLYFSQHLPESNGIIANTFEEFEPKATQAIEDGTCLLNRPTPPIYYMGPLIGEACEGEGHAVTADQHCSLTWLDTQPTRSVVFLCFGSRGTFLREQIKEIAKGLENSGQRFLWVVKNPKEGKGKKIEESTDVDLEALLPEEFLERTRDRGLVVKAWAPQVAVLNHPSLGGFVTHCGWNSVLEAVVAGVPMVAWPLYAEQQLNKAVLVEDMKMAIGMEESNEDGFVSGEEVEKRVRELMEGEEGRELRERSRKKREMALAAWREKGSSTTALAKLLDIWAHGGV